MGGGNKKYIKLIRYSQSVAQSTELSDHESDEEKENKSRRNWTLSRRELGRLLDERDIRVSTQELDAVIEAIGVNTDGRVKARDLESFLQLENVSWDSISKRIRSTAHAIHLALHSEWTKQIGDAIGDEERESVKSWIVEKIQRVMDQVEYKAKNNVSAQIAFASALEKIGLFFVPAEVCLLYSQFVDRGEFDIETFSDFMAGDLSSMSQLEDSLKEKFAEAFDVGQSSRRLYQMFETVDVNGNGIISRGEFSDVLRSVSRYSGKQSFKFRDDEIRVLMEHFDIDGDGVIHYHEFVSAISKLLNLDTSGIDDNADNGEPSWRDSNKHQRHSRRYREQSRSRRTNRRNFRVDIPLRKRKTHRKSQKIDRNILDEETIDQIHDAFNVVDQRRSGRIDSNGLSHALRAFGFNFSQEEIQSTLQQWDSDKDGLLSYEEFTDLICDVLSRKVARGVSMQTREELLQLFNTFDFDGNGCVTEEELVYILENFGGALTPEEIDEIVQATNQNCDNQISFAEFQYLIHLIESANSGQAPLGTPISPTLHKALIKLSQAQQITPQEHLAVFMGMPSVFRLSWLAYSRMQYQHSMERALCPTPDPITGLRFQDLIPLDSEMHRKELRPQGQLLRGKHISFESFLHVQIAVQQARGVPMPDDRNRVDIIGRRVHAALFYNDTSQVEQSNDIIGNIYTLSASWDHREEDRWIFKRSTTGTDDQTFLVRNS